MQLPPVIIMGTHRSGTTLLLGMLRKLGFFAGARIEVHGEALFFLRINEWLMRRAGGAWDYPLPLKTLLGDEALGREAESVLRRAVGSRWFAEYTGSIGQALFNDGRLPSVPWGWKDPRNIFTARLWMKIFPGARLLYIRRNGVDVAKSLHVRATKVEKGGLFKLRRFASKLKTSLSPFEPYILESARCITLEECFRLWEEYTAEGEDVFGEFEGGKIAVGYEDLLNNPYDLLRKAAEFCGLECTEAQIGEVARTVNSDRAFAFVHDSALCEFYEKVKNSSLMRKLGYGDIECR